ncbi:MAG: PAS domain-containing protein [Saprospiraceae bacterium]|nr:PAS domain-containing protein [Saprospiraceae bacterium]
MDYLRNIFDITPNGLLLLEPSPVDKTWHCKLANSAAAELLGFSKIEGMPLDKFFPADVAEKISNKSVDSIHFFLNDHNRWVLASTRQTDNQLSIALTDITELKESAFAERRLMRLYKSLTNSLADNEIILFDKNLNILLSEGVPRFVRLDLEGDLMGKNLNNLFENNAFTFLGEYVSKVFGGERADVEREINGRIYKASVYSDGHDDDGKPDNVVGVLLLKDVSELNKKQRELEVRVQQLDRSNRELQQFAYVASHDLQEPLRKIMSFGERLTRKYDALLTGEGKEYISRMNNAAQRMETLINDLLTFSRSTQTDRKFELTDLNSVFTHVLADMDTVERTKAQITLPDSLPVIESIPSQMRQLFQNLLNNALKFAHKDRPPQVEVSCRLAAGTELPENYALLPEKDYCIIEIEDNGIGFDQSNAERIFTIFQRLHGRSEYGGSGVGLAICKKIADNHQGAIFADGLEGKGALFTVVLPLKQGN